VVYVMNPLTIVLNIVLLTELDYQIVTFVQKLTSIMTLLLNVKLVSLNTTNVTLVTLMYVLLV
jgi:fumarate reductase subunit C